MRHDWVRDIADFAKYGLLKRLAGTDLKLGVLWYLTTHADPKKPLVSYLTRPEEYAPCDAALFDALCRLQNATHTLTLDDIERGNVLPSGTVFYTAPLSTTQLARAVCGAARQQWFENGCALTQTCDLVFLDPDTGLLPRGRKAENAGGEEYATVNEIITLCRRGQSVVCVQFGRPGNLEREPVLARQQLAAVSDAVRAEGFPEPWGLWWRDQHKVGLIVAPNARHESTLCRRRDDILADPAWSRKVSRL